MKIAFFDFDGTLTTRDSFIHFIRFVRGDMKFLIGMGILSPMLLLYKLKLIPNYKAKQMVLSYFFKGMDESSFVNAANTYSLIYMQTILRSEAMKKIDWHKQQGDKIVVVSASMECWIRPWCDRNKLELIATKLEMKNGKVTGRLLTKNCYGIEKVRRIHQTYQLSEYEYIYGYGDSNGDKEMLEMADEKYWRCFERSL